MYYFIKWVEIDHKCNKLTNSNAWFPEMTLFLFWWTNTHMYTRGNRLPLSGRMLRDSVVCSAESHRNWQRRHKSLLPPNIHKKSERQGHRKWTPIDQFPSRWKSCLLFCQIFRKNLLGTHNIVTLILSGRFLCQGQMSAQPGVAHFEVSIGDHFLSVEFRHVNNIGLCTSHLVNFLSRCMVTEAWYTDCDLKIIGKKYSKLGGGGGGGGGCLQNWSSVNKPQGGNASYRGQKSIVPCYNVH